MTRQQLADLAVNAAGRRYVPELEVFTERAAVDFGAPRMERAQCLQFRAEPQRPAIPGVIQRFDAEPVPDQPEAPGTLMPKRDREHADESFNRGDAPMAQRREYDLGISAAAKSISTRLQLRSYFGEVVDLAVEDHDEIAVRRNHRLAAQFGQIEDR